MALCYNVCVYILNDHPAISFGDRTRQSLQRPCGDRAKNVQSSYSHRVIFTTSAQKSYDARAISLRIPYDYLKSLDQFLGPNDSKIVRPPHDQHEVPVRVLCDLPVMCLRATILQFFKTYSAELNKIIEATMPMDLYDDRKVSVRWPHGKGDLDIVWASEGKCNRGINNFRFKWLNVFR